MREFVSVHVGPQQPGIATVLLNREPTNSLTRQAYRELAAAADEVGRRPDVAAVVIFGGHDIFCAGDDLPELRTLDRAEADAAREARGRALDVVAAIPKPTVAAVTGYALGAGLSLMLAADWRVCGDNVKLGATEILAGRLSDTGGCDRLVRAVGPWRAKELAFSGRFVDAKQAFAWGLVDELVGPDDVYDAAVTWAGRFVDSPAEVLAGVKAQVRDSGH